MAVPNPYQAPRMDHDVVAVQFGDFTIGRSLSQAFEATKRYFPLWLGVGLVAVVLMMLSIITIIGYVLLLPIFTLGLTRFLLNMVDGTAQFNDLFAGFSSYGKVLGRTLLLTVCFVGLALLGDSIAIAGQLMESPTVQAVGSLVYMVFSFTVMVRLYFSMFFIVDRDMPALEALSASWNATRGKTLKLVGLAFVAVLLAMAGLLALLVGVVFTLMMSYVAYACAYRQTVGPSPAT